MTVPSSSAFPATTLGESPNTISGGLVAHTSHIRELVWYHHHPNYQPHFTLLLRPSSFLSGSALEVFLTDVLG